MKAILIIGAAGFIGSALTDYFARTGCRVLALSRRVPGAVRRDGVEYFSASQDNMEVISSLLPDCGCVIHAASDSTPGVTASQPTLEVDLNIRPTLRFLEAMRAHPEVHLIYLSSAGALYHSACGTRSAEQDATLPRSNYGAGKLAIEAFIGANARCHGGRATILRPTNVFGPGQHYRPGFGIVPTLMAHALDEREFQVWGDGAVERDYLFIDDLAALCARAWLDPAGESDCRMYNAGSGVPITTLELVALVSELTGRTLRTRFKPIRSVDPPRIVVDSGKAERELNWKPAVSLREGLGMAWDWFQTQRWPSRRDQSQ